MKPKRQQPEYDSQCTVVEWARLKERTFPALGLLYAIPNSGKFPVQYRVKLAKQGLLPGIPDLCLPIPNKHYHSLRVEMKSKDGRLSKEQKQIKNLLESYGNKVVVCWSAEEAIKAIADYLLNVKDD